VVININEDVFIPAYRHLLESDCDINFLWGGRDSGKSHFVASKLLMDCLKNEYFRCILIKKTHESIKDSQWQMIKDIAESWGVSHLFDFTSSPLEIRCVNGNKFISRGCDNHGKLRGVTNPSHAWYEEGNQLTEDDFTTSSTTLRGEVRVQQWFTFNPESQGVKENYWLYKNYFTEVPYDCYFEWSKKHVIDGEEVILKFSSTHTNYKVNPYVRPERKAQLEELYYLNYYWYEVYTLGRWGKQEIKRPYCLNFKTDKHVKPCAFNPKLQVIFSLDFNVEPFVCEAAHIWTDNTGMHFHNFKELVIEKNGDVESMCDLLESTFGIQVMSNSLFTGDAMQRKREITQRNNIDAWRIIDNRFRLGRRLMVPRGNPSVKENRHLLNSIHAFHTDFRIDPSCKKLVYDCQFAEANEDGDLVKKDRNKESQRLDALDCHRYMCNTFLHDFLERYRIK